MIKLRRGADSFYSLSMTLPTLHDAIYDILDQAGCSMSSREIADKNRELGLWVRQTDGEYPNATQIMARARRPEHGDTFEIDTGHRISLA
jgi:hypothetical protein